MKKLKVLSAFLSTAGLIFASENWTETFSLPSGGSVTHTPTGIQLKSGGLTMNLGGTLHIGAGSSTGGITPTSDLILQKTMTREQFIIALRSSGLLPESASAPIPTVQNQMLADIFELLKPLLQSGLISPDVLASFSSGQLDKAELKVFANDLERISTLPVFDALGIDTEDFKSFYQEAAKIADSSISDAQLSAVLKGDEAAIKQLQSLLNDENSTVVGDVLRGAKAAVNDPTHASEILEEAAGAARMDATNTYNALDGVEVLANQMDQFIGAGQNIPTDLAEAYAESLGYE